jgi:hypothetical protein
MQLRKYHIFRALAPSESGAIINLEWFLCAYAHYWGRRDLTMGLSDVWKRQSEPLYLNHSTPPDLAEAATRCSNRLLGSLHRTTFQLPQQ